MNFLCVLKIILFVVLADGKVFLAKDNENFLKNQLSPPSFSFAFCFHFPFLANSFFKNVVLTFEF